MKIVERVVLLRLSECIVELENAVLKKEKRDADQKLMWDAIFTTQNRQEEVLNIKRKETSVDSFMWPPPMASPNQMASTNGEFLESSSSCSSCCFFEVFLFFLLFLVWF